jgi:hypothetical protein
MASNEFNEAYIGAGTYAAVTCDCGITYFVSPPEYSDSYNEGEYERLLEQSEENPDKFKQTYGCISYGHIDSRCIVLDCECKTADKYENFILNHKELISSFLNASLKRDVTEAVNAFNSNKIKTKDEVINEYWFDLDSAPKDSSWFLGLTEEETIEEVHYACDLSGEEQPPFKGYFKRVGTYFSEVKITKWKPLKKEENV